MTPVRVVRLLLSAWLLWIVWNHAHWSVAVVLALMTVTIEVLADILSGLVAAQRELLLAVQKSTDEIIDRVRGLR